MADELRGKVVMLTGATGGAGRGVAVALAEAGARIALISRDATSLADVIDGLGGDTDRFKGFPADLNAEEAVDTLIEHIVEQFGRIDTLVHTVGGYMAGDPVHESSVEVWDKMMNLNARVVYLVAGKVAGYMVGNDIQGSITIVLARAASRGSKGHAAYTASKAAATRIMESMAAELRDARIRVNGVSPGTIDTPDNREAMPNADFARWVRPRQIGNLMVFLASDAAADITGANIEITART